MAAVRPKKRTLSDRLKNMRFMKQREETSLREKLLHDQKRRKKDAHWTIETNDQPQRTKPVVVIEDGVFGELTERRIGRQSFGKFNSVFESHEIESDETNCDKRIGRNQEDDVKPNKEESGKSGNVVWPSLSPQQKQRCTERLKACFEELRTCTVSCIAAANFGAVCSDYLDDQYAGLFRNEDELNDALVPSLCGTRICYAPHVRRTLKSGHKIVSSHGDFSLGNIVIRDGELSAIVDWELASFYPEYWDYAVAQSGLVWRKPDIVDWKESIQIFLKPYPAEATTLNIMINFSLFGH